MSVLHTTRFNKLLQKKLSPNYKVEAVVSNSSIELHVQSQYCSSIQSISSSQKKVKAFRVTSKTSLREHVVKDMEHLKLVEKTSTEILAVNTLKVMSIIQTAKLQIPNTLYPNITTSRNKKQK